MAFNPPIAGRRVTTEKLNKQYGLATSEFVILLPSPNKYTLTPIFKADELLQQRSCAITVS